MHTPDTAVPDTTSRSAAAPYLIIASVTSATIIIFAALAIKPTYRFAPAFLLPVTWVIFFLLRKLSLAPLHYAIVCSAMILHMSGAFGFYQQSPFPFSFDILVHYYFAFAITFPLHRFFATHIRLRPFHIAVLTFLVMMGLAALHEIMEYSSYLLLGEDTGMLKPTTSYFFDTQRDLLNNLLGTLTALALIAVFPTRTEVIDHSDHRDHREEE